MSTVFIVGDAMGIPVDVRAEMTGNTKGNILIQKEGSEFCWQDAVSEGTGTVKTILDEAPVQVSLAGTNGLPWTRIKYTCDPWSLVLTGWEGDSRVFDYVYKKKEGIV